MKARSIPPLIIDWLLRYGSTRFDGRGAVIHYFDKAARRRLEKDVGRAIVRKTKEFLDCYAVFVDDVLITAGWHYKRRS
jgi:hypothetical protein